jgi:hypothetical protein
MILWITQNHMDFGYIHRTNIHTYIYGPIETIYWIIDEFFKFINYTNKKNLGFDIWNCHNNSIRLKSNN